MTEEEKKELPPIEEVACSEAEFKEKRMDPALEALKEEFKLDEKAILAKA